LPAFSFDVYRLLLRFAAISPPFRCCHAFDVAAASMPPPLAFALAALLIDFAVIDFLMPFAADFSLMPD